MAEPKPKGIAEILREMAKMRWAIAYEWDAELNAAAAALAEQAETIERLRDGLREIQQAALKTWDYSAAAPFPDCPFYLGFIRGTAARCLSGERGAAEPKPLPTESAKGSDPTPPVSR